MSKCFFILVGFHPVSETEGLHPTLKINLIAASGKFFFAVERLSHCPWRDPVATFAPLFSPKHWQSSLTFLNWAHKSGVLPRSAFDIALRLIASINVHGAFPKIYWWSSRSHLRERTLPAEFTRHFGLFSSISGFLLVGCKIC